MSSTLIGHDGEFFITQGGQVVCSQGIIPGTKRRPAKLDTCTLHRDNALGEFGTEPSTDSDEFVGIVTTALAEIQGQLQKRGYDMLFKAHHIFSPEELLHPETLVFGCDPDFDCWRIELAKSVNAMMAETLRSAGGHVHAGFDWVDEDDQYRAAASAEVVVGLRTILLDDDVTRRKIYGQAGSFRPKPYGIEYRVPSNFWYNDADLMMLMHKSMQCAVDNRDLIVSMIDDEVAALIRDAINNSNKILASQLLEHFEVEEMVYAS